ncbi:MAG: hypothetical protein ACM31L_08260 [Actinomycetota bacterium]
MYLRHLDERQRKNLLVMAFEMMVADHVIRDGEKEVIEALKQELHVPNVRREDFANGPDLFLFRDRRSQIAAMLKLASIGFADKEYHRMELRMLVRYAQEFGLSLDELKTIEEWGRKHYWLVHEAEALMARPNRGPGGEKEAQPTPPPNP